MNILQQKFIFLSQVVGIPVYDYSSGKRIGTVLDVAASLKELYPRASALVVRLAGKKKLNIPWSKIKKLDEGHAVYFEPNGTQGEFSLGEADLLLKETFWDKQIVDTNGSKVVRVNDLHLLREGLSLWLVHVDVGFTGLLRRLGCLNVIQFLYRLICSCELKDRLISWKFVEPVHSLDFNSLSLKAHHSKLAELLPEDLAGILTDLGVEERIAVLRSLDTATAANTFQDLPMKIRVQIAGLIDQKMLLGIIHEMPMDESADLISQLPQKKINSLLARLPQDKAAQLSGLLSHAKHVAGSIMNTDFFSVRHTMTSAQALEKVKGDFRKKETCFYIYVLDDNDALTGVITLQQLLSMPADRPVSEFMRKRIAKVKVDTDINDVAEVFYKYDFILIPVVDKFNKIQGVIAMKDAFESVFKEIRQETQVSS